MVIPPASMAVPIPNVVPPAIRNPGDGPALVLLPIATLVKMIPTAVEMPPKVVKRTPPARGALCPASTSSVTSEVCGSTKVEDAFIRSPRI